MKNEFYYILGYLWADGYFPKKYNEIRLEISSSDAYNIINYFKQTDERWRIYDRKVDNRTDCQRKPLSFISFSNKKFKDLLLLLGFGNRDQGLKKIIEYIPSDKLKYFFRGYSDGDGCFYYNSKQHLRQYHISSTYNTDWDSVIEFFNSINISFRLNKRIQTRKEGKFSSSSKIMVSNQKEITKLIEYLYDDFEQNKIGLIRKYDKAQEILKSTKQWTKTSI